MSKERETFLQRLRQALAEGNRAGKAPQLDERGSTGYQGGGADLVERFGKELEAAGGYWHVVKHPDDMVDKVIGLLEARQARKILLGQDPFVGSLNWQGRLQEGGREVVGVETLKAATARQGFFEADIGISGAQFLIAETGSVVLFSSPRAPRSLSLLPPVHLVLAERRQLVSDLFDLFSALGNGKSEWTESGGRRTPAEVNVLPSCLTLVTGPSKTGDIELRLVTGVHGPGEIHVILLDSGRFQ